MSHTTTVSTIAITDIGALRAAVDELKRRGMRIDMIDNAVPRAYYDGQQGLGQADHVLRLADSKYDIGIYANGKGGYEARADFYNGEIERVLGATPQDGEDTYQAKMGKMYQMYAVVAAEQAAFRQGYSPRRVEQEDGTIQLVMEVAA